MKSGCGKGAIVTLKVDYRTNCHAPGLLAIVFDFKLETEGILVCCEHVLITHDGSVGEYWVPYDKYKVSASRDPTLPFAYELQKVRDMILSGEYNPKEQKRISFSKCVYKEVNSTSPGKRTKGCGCKRGCNKSCGCKKKVQSITVGVSVMGTMI